MIFTGLNLGSRHKYNSIRWKTLCDKAGVSCVTEENVSFLLHTVETEYPGIELIRVSQRLDSEFRDDTYHLSIAILPDTIELHDLAQTIKEIIKNGPLLEYRRCAHDLGLNVSDPVLYSYAFRK